MTAHSLPKLKVRLISPFQKYHETDTAIFSNAIPTEKADALLCEWSPHDELFSFPRRKAWYCCEPACQFPHIGDGTWAKSRNRLQPSEFLFHAHDDERYRVPHITHFQPLQMNIGSDRNDRAIAIVSNHGGSPRKRHAEIAYRNRFITHSGVDLFGRSSWKTYRRGLFSLPSAPKNYQGEILGDWPADEKRTLQKKYRAAVCLENMCSPYYFTEKFVEAVIAGCIPIYQAHPTTADSVLSGAKWVDPANYDHAPDKVIQAAKSCSLQNVQSQNQQWLSQNTALQQTHASAVFERIGQILTHE